jgi:hypothetical protein
VLDLIVQSAQHALREREWLSCTNVASRSRRAKARAFQLSMKNPRSSPNTLGSISLTPSRSVALTFIGRRARAAGQKVLPVAVLRHLPAELVDVGRADVTEPIRDLSGQATFKPWPALDRRDVLRRFEQRLVRAVSSHAIPRPITSQASAPARDTPC